jgi:DNA-binding MarR family transcriptional regulator
MDRLVRNSLVRRDLDDDDRRLVRHSLTAAGLQTVDELEQLSRRRMDRVFSRLTPDQLERLVVALADLSSAADAVEAEEAGRVSV